MNFTTTVADLIDDPQRVIDRTSARELGWAGVFGYLLGAFSLFTFLRFFSAVPPGACSFIGILILVLGVNFFFASGIHLFLEMTGACGNALKLFFLLGLTELFWSVLIPLGFMAKLDYLSPVTDFLLCFIVIVVARISVIRRLYAISRSKALLSISMPYAAIVAGFFMVFTYAIIYLIWLIV